MNELIHSLVMPKWGITMTEGTLVTWLAEEGDEIRIGQDVAEVETDKMLGSVEAQAAGILRRRLATEGDVVTVGGLLGIIAPPSVVDTDIESFIDQFETEAASSPIRAPASTWQDSALGPVRHLVVGDGGDVVVAIHGLGGDALNWRFNMEALAVGGTVLAFDLPGHGESTKSVGGGSVAEIASCVDTSLDTYPGQSLHLVAHSMGALVAVEIAERRLDAVQSLTMIAPAGFGSGISQDFVDGLVTASSRREVRAVLEMLFANPNLVSRELVEEVLRYKREDGVSDALGVLRDRLFPDGKQQHGIVDNVAAMNIPVSVVWGVEDRVLPAEQRYAVPKSARVHPLEGVGHSPHVEAVGEVNQILSGALIVSGHSRGLRAVANHLANANRQLDETRRLSESPPRKSRRGTQEAELATGPRAPATTRAGPVPRRQ